jgi:tRNA (cmo5U34)-methyltransferase
VSDWTFTDFGPKFDVHVAAHLPGYMDVQRLVALVAQHFIPPGGVLADYGASTGRTAEVLRSALDGRQFTAYLYDSDQSMLDEAARRVPDSIGCVRTFPSTDPLVHPPADLSLCLWLLQFIPPQNQRDVLRQIRAGSADSGVLLVATKTRHLDSRWEDVAVAALDDYKAEQGVDAEERAAKSRSLRGTMYPLTTATLINDLSVTGWTSPTLLWRWHIWSVVGAFAT